MSNFLTAVAAATGVFWGGLNIFAWFEDALTQQRKDEITQLLKSSSAFANNKVLTLSMERFHNGLFGEKQFSVKCIIRTVLFSILSLSLLIITFFVSVGELGLFGTMIFYLAFYMAFITLPVDFIGVYTTRIFIKWLGGGVTIIRALSVFLLEIIVKAMTALIVIIAYSSITARHITVEIEFLTLYLVFGALSNVICSIWAWLYLIGFYIVSATVSFFDVDKKPVRSIGIVGSAIFAVFYGGYFFVTK